MQYFELFDGMEEIDETLHMISFKESRKGVFLCVDGRLYEEVHPGDDIQSGFKYIKFDDALWVA